MRKIDLIEEGLEDYENMQWHEYYCDCGHCYDDDEYYYDDPGFEGCFHLGNYTIAKIEINDKFPHCSTSIYIKNSYEDIGRVTMMQTNIFSVIFSLPVNDKRNIKVSAKITVSDEPITKAGGYWFSVKDITRMKNSPDECFPIIMEEEAMLCNIKENTLIAYKVNGRYITPNLPALIGDKIANDVEINQATILQTILFDRDYGNLIRKMWKEGKFD